MWPSANRRWAVFSLLGIGLWVGATVAVAVINDDPSDPRPVVLAFATGAALFFGAIFTIALLQTRARTDPELDALLAELALEPGAAAGSAAAIAPMRRVARVYIVLGIVVTALGLAAIVQEGLGVGSAEATLFVTVGIVGAWALAVPWVLRTANAASAAVLSPLGLVQQGATFAGERHGRRVGISIGAEGSVTKLAAATTPPSLSGAEILAYTGRGTASTWEGVEVSGDGERIVVRRRGHRGASWVWDLWLAERLAGGGS